jgi:hypothetical protein
VTNIKAWGGVSEANETPGQTALFEPVSEGDEQLFCTTPSAFDAGCPRYGLKEQGEEFGRGLTQMNADKKHV